MQKAFSRGQGILSALSRTIHLESGIHRKLGMSRRHDPAALYSNLVLAVFLLRNFYAVKIIFTTEAQRFFYKSKQH